jgi:hypothetical protein
VAQSPSPCGEKIGLCEDFCPAKKPLGCEKAPQGREVRTFDTGATRDADLDKIDYEGFLSPLVLERYGQYMHQHRKQSDGKLRASDNWQKGIPITAYMKSKFRHFMDTWKWVRRTPNLPKASLEDSLCAELFNTSGLLHEVLKAKMSQQKEKT